MFVLLTCVALWLWVEFINAHQPCTHEAIMKDVTVHKQPIQTKSQLSDLNRRRLLDEENTEQIRITADFTGINVDSELTEQRIKHLTKIVFEYHSTLLKVDPVDGPLQIEQAQCHYVEIPTEHRSAGINDTDLMVYLSSEEATCSSELAHAVPCLRDSLTGRPLAGMINLCPSFIRQVSDTTTDDWFSLSNILAHELIHIIGFSSNHFGHFDVSDDQSVLMQSESPLTEGDAMSLEDGSESVNGSIPESKVFVVTPRVRDFVRRHTGCDGAIGAQLEDDGQSGTAISHWEERVFAHETMNGMAWPGRISFLSQLTLALLADSNWYSVDLSLGHPLFFGSNGGCEFLDPTHACVDSETSKSNWPEFFCDAEADEVDSSQACTADGFQMGSCQVFEYADGEIPEHQQWYEGNPNLGGRHLSEYCPIVAASELDGETRNCLNPSHSSLVDSVPNVFGSSSSRCVAGSLRGCLDYTTTQRAYCFEMECLDFNASAQSFQTLRIHIGDESVDCDSHSLGEKRTVDGYKGHIQCPSVDLYCATERPFHCKFGFWNQESCVCQCLIGYSGDDCSVADLNSTDISMDQHVYTFMKSPSKGNCSAMSLYDSASYLGGGEETPVSRTELVCQLRSQITDISMTTAAMIVGALMLCLTCVCGLCFQGTRVIHKTIKSRPRRGLIRV